MNQNPSFQLCSQVFGQNNEKANDWFDLGVSVTHHPPPGHIALDDTQTGTM